MPSAVKMCEVHPKSPRQVAPLLSSALAGDVALGGTLALTRVVSVAVTIYAFMAAVTAVAVQWKIGRNPEMDELHAE